MQQGNIAVIGSGISGIATAHELKKLGFNVDIFEKDSFIGGRVASMELDGSPITIGGENIGQNYKEFRNFCMDIGIENFKEYGLNITTVSRKKDININKNHMIKTFINILRIMSFNDIKK
ncbi:MAG TPA: NAD(P)/FAD-dependent oxidoreductase [Arcobacter sp.]|nr:NAD(P)/FAD-dependent oxidoreductase [Arcobacter sp.]